VTLVRSLFVGAVFERRGILPLYFIAGLWPTTSP
jgi:hypothetical protein